MQMVSFGECVDVQFVLDRRMHRQIGAMSRLHGSTIFDDGEPSFLIVRFCERADDQVVLDRSLQR